MDKENSKREIQKLVEKYDKLVKENKVSAYNEEMTKKDFIQPLFHALGWDIQDSSEVTAEENVSKKRVDYGFRINGILKFMLEVKKLKEDVLNTKFVEQAIDYSWNKGCTWAVLTNFETTIIFNAEWKTESAWYNRFKTIGYNEFLDRFDELWLLSKESFEQNLINEEAEKVGKKVKKTSIDKQLLMDFTRFRELLSKNITKLNQNNNLSEEELDESVQRILDRLIFIRNCEDRELEPKILISNYREWSNRGRGQLIKSIRDTFISFDKQYNSKIFSEHLCDSLDIDNDVLQEIIESLYYTKDKSISYDFSAIDADVLGSIYEQYLSHILKKTNKRAKLTENIIHRKEQGIYYTPHYIVDYIVKNTVGKYIENNKNNIEQIKILDPACGSGSFLIKAYDVLNEYHSKNDKTYHQAELDFKLDIIFTKKSKILQNNIFGVDLDRQAVEIAQLNLLLKIAEKKEKLPLLEENIKCGNSLIDDEKIAGDKAFKWEKEFLSIVAVGGFDVIIGNPPYGASFSDGEKDFIKSKFKSASGRYDSYYYFIERAITLLKDKALLGFITPDTWLTNVQTKNLRELVLSNCKIIKIVSLPQDVFPEANVDTCIIILQKELNQNTRKKHIVIVSVLGKDAQLSNLQQSIFENTFNVTQEEWMNNARFLFNIYQSKDNLVEKIKIDTVLLGKITEICRGINPYAKSELIKKHGKVRGTQIVEERVWHSDKKESAEYKKELVGSDIGKYSVDWKSGKYVKYGEWLSRPRDPKFFTLPHIVVQRIRNPKLKTRIVATFLNPIDDYYNNSGLTNIIMADDNYSITYVLAVLNSKLMNWYYRQFFRDVNIKPEDLRELPTKEITETEQKQFDGLVKTMLSLNRRIVEFGDKKTDERNRIEEEIKKIDCQINDLVYKIYAINEDEKEIIEESLK